MPIKGFRDFEVYFCTFFQIVILVKKNVCVSVCPFETISHLMKLCMHNVHSMEMTRKLKKIACKVSSILLDGQGVSDPGINIEAINENGMTHA